MREAARLAVLPLLGLLLGASPAAGAVSHPQQTTLVRGILGAATVDGDRLAAWPSGTARLMVYDDRARKKHLIALRRTCDAVIPIDATNGLFLITCRNNVATGFETRQILFNYKNRSITDLPQGAEYRRIGSQWAEGLADFGDGPIVIYTNWHTRESRSEGETTSGARIPFDLDSKNLDPLGPAASEFAIASGRVLEQVRSRGRWTMRLMTRKTDQRVALCGSKCHPQSLKGLALWREGSTKLFGYEVGGKHRRREWRISPDATVLGATRKRVYYLLPNANNPQFSDLHSFSWP